jgi:hypothetical protein
MLGDSSDCLVVARIVVDGWSDRGRWVEELAAQVLQQSQALGVMVSPRQPREARSSTAHTSDRQLVSPGSRPITLVRRRVSPKVRSMKLECRIRRWCSTQIAGELLAVGEQAAHRRG